MATTITANGINFPDGSASAPSIGGTDTNTGLFTGSDLVGFATGGLERIRIDSSGRVIIGDDHANNAFAGGDSLIIGNEDNGTRSGITLVSASNTDGGLYFSHGSSNTAQGQVVYHHANNYMAFYVNGNKRALDILSSGDVCIGRNGELGNAKVSIQCDAAEAAIGVQLNSSSGTSDLIQAYSSSGPNVASICVNPDSSPELLLKLHDGSNTVERLRILSTGRIGINESSPNATLHIKNADGGNNRLELVHANDSANEQNKITFKNNTTEYASITSGKDGSNNSIGLTIGTGGSERARITSNGKLWVATTTDNTDAPVVARCTSGYSFAAIKDNTAPSIVFGGVTQPRALLEAKHNASTLQFHTATGSTYASAGWATRMEIESNGNVKINDGDLYIGTAGHGIDFSVTGDGGTSIHEKFTDYEEGSWTPEIRKGDTTSNGTATSVHGKYVRVGKLLWLQGYYYKSSGSNTGSGSWKIFGLPFSIVAGSSTSYASAGEGYLGFNGTNQFNSDKNWRWQANHSDRLTMYSSLTDVDWTSGYFEVSFGGCFLVG
tara:strand:+ start:234 stop:1886 length:1653 start_codon:yes stop_codon:yes gene_type:complete